MQEARTIEAEVRRLLDETRAANEMYASAQYERDSGLNRRLETIEDALLRLARALDQR